MTSLQPDADAINAILSDIKCSFSTLYSQKLIEDEYFIKLCKSSILDIPFGQAVKEKRLLIFLLDNIKFLNYKNEYAKDITNCDLNKIYNLK